ncbi:MAG: hypothetical protein ACI8PZ_005662 [Myxococcota bacterium]|jgi:hypothetical protein
MSFPKKPVVPLGASYTPSATKDPPPTPMSGPEFPTTAAARPSAVDDDQDGGDSVIDDGPVKPAAGPSFRPVAKAPRAHRDEGDDGDSG